MRPIVAGVAIVMMSCGLAVAPAGAGSPPHSSLTDPIYIPATIGSPYANRAYASVGTLSRFAAAPVPNLDEDAPVLRTLGPARAQVSPSLFRRTSTYRGEGFTTGSTAEAEQTRRSGPTPGVNLSMPLQ